MSLIYGPEEVWRPYVDKKTGKVQINHLAVLISSTKMRIYAATEELIEVKAINPAVWDHPVIPTPRVPQKRLIYSRNPKYGIGRKRRTRDPKYSS